MDDMPLSQQFENIERRWGDWENYKRSYFIMLDPQARATELFNFDQHLSEEAHNAPRSREFAEHWTRRRQLAELDALMKRGGR